jgi:hypothetical protein
MARLVFGLAAAAVAFTVYVFVDVLMTPRDRMRAMPKWAWAVLVVVLPAVGGILWLTLGKIWRQGRPAARAVAPDDDPNFLRKLADDREREERLRRLEQELADLDDDKPKE